MIRTDTYGPNGHKIVYTCVDGVCTVPSVAEQAERQRREEARDAELHAKSHPKEQTIEQLAELYPVLSEHPNAKQHLADLLAVPEFAALPKEWVSDESDHRYGCNLEFTAETVGSIAAKMAAEIAAAPNAPHHLVLSLHFVAYCSEFCLYYKAIPTPNIQ